MELKVYSVRSLVNQDLDALTERFLGSLKPFLNADIVLSDPREIGNADPCIVYIASGGSEMQFLRMAEGIRASKVYLLTSGSSNSLAASMEILSFIRAHGRTGEILHGSPREVACRLTDILRASAAKKRLSGMALGQVGEPSDWLIASHSDRDALRDKLGMQIVDISQKELLEEYGKHSFEENRWTELLEHSDFDRTELRKALDLYGAFHRLVEKYRLGGLTVRCFDLLTSVKTTGCLGLAILNAEGIYGGCEGDMPSLASMAVLGEVSGKPVFMCNPSRIDEDAGEMILAHCTLPLNMPYQMDITTHFESGIGAAIAGSIPEGKCTVFKLAGDLSRAYAETGTIRENLRDSTLCRSQIKVSLPSFRYFLENPISNHHLVCCGDYKNALTCFMDSL